MVTFAFTIHSSAYFGGKNSWRYTVFSQFAVILTSSKPLLRSVFSFHHLSIISSTTKTCISLRNTRCFVRGCA